MPIHDRHINQDHMSWRYMVLGEEMLASIIYDLLILMKSLITTGKTNDNKLGLSQYPIDNLSN